MSWPSVLRKPVFLSTRPPFHSSLLEPSKRTMAPAGAFWPSVGLLRFVLLRETLFAPVNVRVLPSLTAVKSVTWPTGGNLAAAENSNGDWARYLRLALAGT